MHEDFEVIGEIESIETSCCWARAFVSFIACGRHSGIAVAQTKIVSQFYGVRVPILVGLYPSPENSPTEVGTLTPLIKTSSKD